MNNLIASLILIVLLFGGALVGLSLRSVLPQRYFGDDSKSIVMLSVGMVLTMSALVLGLLVSSAHGAYEAQRNELTEISAKVILLDRILARYGPESKDARDQLRAIVVRALDQGREAGRLQDKPMSADAESLYEKILQLSPKDAAQRATLDQAVGLALSIAQTRWLMHQQTESGFPRALLVALAFWLTIVFGSFGLFAPRNATVVASFFLSALSISCAILMILEMYAPQLGLIQISSGPLRAAVAQLGQ